MLQCKIDGRTALCSWACDQRKDDAVEQVTTIRRLGSCGSGAIRDHLLRLDDEDRRLRFSGPVSAARIEAHCASLDLSRVPVLGGVVAGTVRGIAELRPLPGGWPRAAEVAISVERRHQGRGIGGALLHRLTLVARNRWILRLHLLCLVDNGRMMRLARGLGGGLSFAEGQVEGTIDLAWPTPWTVLEEVLGEAAARWPTRPRGASPACGARWDRARACAGGSSAA
jgi:GNAT superfamily N-acetyltransferase